MSAEKAKEHFKEAASHAHVAEIHMQNLEVDNVPVGNALANTAIAEALIGIGYALLEVAKQMEKLTGQPKPPTPPSTPPLRRVSQ